MRRRMRLRRALAPGIVVGGLAWLFTIKTSEAGNHELTNIRNDSVDLTASVEWDFDVPPTEGLAAGAGREYLEEAFRQMAASTFTATEGRFRICKVFIHKDGYRGENVDVLVVNQGGRSHAPLIGLKTALEHINAFVASKDAQRKRNSTELGKTLAHEFGHYGLNLGDEYTEPKDERGPLAPELRRPLQPQHCDVRLDTLMGTKATDTFSIAATYRYPAWSGGPADGGPKYLKYDDCYELKDPEPNAPKEDATWRTGHFRHHQRSAFSRMEPHRWISIRPLRRTIRSTSRRWRSRPAVLDAFKSRSRRANGSSIRMPRRR